MKSLLFTICLLCGACSFGQRVKAELSVNQWAGGVCCTSGTNYSLSLRVKGGKKECFDSVRLELANEASFVLSDTDFTPIYSGDTLTIFTLNFSHSTNEYSYREELPTSTYFGPESLREFYWGFGQKQEDLSIVLMRDRKSTICNDVTIHESITAYP